MTLEATKIFNFEMAHALYQYDGDCRNIHGHSYQLYITVEGEPIHENGHAKDGMIIDFKDLKSIVKKNVIDHYDHALVINKSTTLEVINVLRKHHEKLILFDKQPTCENLTLHIVDSIKNELPRGVFLKSVKLYETATSFVKWNNEKM